MEDVPVWVKVLDAPAYYGDQLQKGIAGALRSYRAKVRFALVYYKIIDI